MTPAERVISKRKRQDPREGLLKRGPAASAPAAEGENPKKRAKNRARSGVIWKPKSRDGRVTPLNVGKDTQRN